MTALSADDQKARGESLGADRFLVKSQVGIEDVVNAVHEVLNDTNGTPAATATAPTTDNMMTQFVAAPAQTPVATPTQSVSPAETAMQTQAPMQSISSAQPAVPAQPFTSAQPATQAQSITPTQPVTQAQPVQAQPATPVQTPINNSNPFLGNV